MVEVHTRKAAEVRSTIRYLIAINKTAKETHEKDN